MSYKKMVTGLATLLGTLTLGLAIGGASAQAASMSTMPTTTDTTQSSVTSDQLEPITPDEDFTSTATTEVVNDKDNSNSRYTRSVPLLTHATIQISRNKINGSWSNYCTIGSSVTSNLAIPKAVILHLTIDGKPALTIPYKAVGKFAHKEQKLPKAIKMTGKKHTVGGYMIVTAPGYKPSTSPIVCNPFV
ncbi:hypothetical protein [Secundilactobacillus kimchicus]|uniref:hypothetical protein n=1 Tax=Secundilactobacillus kimchicus TaxID=528209 RepID=UPI0024A93496|nr:hypothetical protein [Secundilactobacillus kimchicus]